MANVTSGIKTAAIASLPLDGIQTIVDLGGADGAVLAAILPAHPDMRGVLFDLPHVIADAPEALADLASRTGSTAWQATSSLGAPGGDGYLLPRAARLARPPGPAHPAQHRRAAAAAHGC